MANMFRRDTILQPIKGRIRSNDYGISKIKKLKLLHVNAHWGSKGQHRYECEILEGTTTRFGRTYRKGDKIQVFSDAVEEEVKNVLYEIY